MSFNSLEKAGFEPVLWLLGNAIDNTYKPLLNAAGTSIFTSPSRIFLLQNMTDGDIMVSIDRINMHIPLLKGTATVIDIMANHPEPGGSNAIPKNISVYVTDLSTANAAFATVATGFVNATTGAVFLTSSIGR